MSHEHEWSKVGISSPSGTIIPCKDDKCEAYMQVSNGNQQLQIFETGWPMSINNLKLDIEDDPEGGVAKIICKETEECKLIDKIPFEDGDIVIDIGAHVGIVSIYLAKRYPNIVIHAFEPLQENYKRLLRNLKANDVTNVIEYPIAVSSDGRDIALKGINKINTGAASIYVTEDGGRKVESIALEEFMKINKIKKIKLLKIDCEGAEHEIIMNNPTLLSKVEYMVGELHINKNLERKGYSNERLAKVIGTYMNSKNVMLTACRMSE